VDDAVVRRLLLALGAAAPTAAAAVQVREAGKQLRQQRARLLLRQRLRGSSFGLIGGCETGLRGG